MAQPMAQHYVYLGNITSTPNFVTYVRLSNKEHYSNYMVLLKVMFEKKLPLKEFALQAYGQSQCNKAESSRDFDYAVRCNT